mmetsp:Transcript_104677/g.291557  ORF Transcript_104677/g.291557 Transcript_104677/m.291557 type:complete len:379 (-) Transcript_104677:64-1200(-)
MVRRPGASDDQQVAEEELDAQGEQVAEEVEEVADADNEQQPQLEESLQILLACGDADLAAILKTVLENRPAVVQEMVDWAVPGRAYVSSRLLMENRVCGMIKSFNDVTGYGFIDCPAVHEAFGHDAFLHHSQLGTFDVGSEVSFAILLSKGGKPQAFDLGPALNGRDLHRQKDRAGGLRGGGPARGGAGGCGAPKGWGGPGGWDAPAWWAGGCWGPPGSPAMASPPLPPPPLPMQQGHAPYEARGRRDRRERSRAFSPRPGGSGSGRARSMVRPREPAPLPLTEHDAPGLGDQRFVGFIKSFNDQKGFGFIENDELKSMYGSDVFVHIKQLGNFQVGDTVSFSVFFNKDEKIRARELRLPDEFPGGDVDVPRAKKFRK